MFRRFGLSGLALFAALVLAVPSPTAAGQRQRRPDGPRAERGGGGGGGDRGGRGERAIDRGSFQRPSVSPSERAQADRGNGGGVGRGDRSTAGGGRAGRENGGGGNRNGRGVFGRGNNDRGFDGGSYGRGRNVPQRPVYRPNSGWNARPSFRPAYRESYRPAYRPAYRPMYSRPFYSFRPRLSLGVGLWAGVNVPFATFGIGLTVPVRPYLTARYRTYVPYAGRYGYDRYGYDGYSYGQPVYGTSYPVPTPYPAPYPVPYPVSQPVGSTLPAQPVGATPGYGAGYTNGYPANADLSQFGGLSFDIAPTDAQLYVDGEYVGTISMFSPESQPLTLPVGVHRIEIRAAGYAPTVFDATVTAGLVTPYQGALTPQYN